MQRVNDHHPRPIVIVLGCDEVGSAIAHLAEIDPSGDPTRCFGIEPRAGAIAAAVSDALVSECSTRAAAIREGRPTAAP